MPRKNQANLEDLPDYVRESMTIHFISDVGEAIRLALVSEPESCYTSSLMEQPILPLFPHQRQEMVLKASPAQHGAGRGESD
jgi:ATP-dependent Lon protease